MRTFALIPAAGLSRRMGRPKLLLPLGDRTILAHVIDTLRAAHVAEVLVVLAPGDEALQEIAVGANANVLRLDLPTPDMRATCLRGLDWLEQRQQPERDDGFLLAPADHPTMRSDVVSALISAAPQHPDTLVIVPAYQGQRGHPVWVRWRCVPEIRALPEGAGLNRFIRAQAARTHELDWADPEVLRDLDTPEDYERLLRDWRCS
jgi:molybdenum cofactor cytidylyltransferase